jgi:hypothetical protein
MLKQRTRTVVLAGVSASVLQFSGFLSVVVCHRFSYGNLFCLAACQIGDGTMLLTYAMADYWFMTA